MRPSRVDDLFVDQDEPYPDIRQQPGSAPGQLDEAGNASGPRQPHLGQVVERGDTHVLVDMLSQRRGRTTGRRGGGALARSARPRAPLPSWRPRRGCHRTPRRLVQSSQPSWSAQHPDATRPWPRPNRRRTCPMCAREHHDHDQEAHNAPRVALVRLRRALGACKAARAQQGAGPPRRLVQGDRALQRVTKVVRP